MVKLGKIWVAILLILCLWITGCGSGTPTDSNVTHLTLWHGINPPPNREVFQELVDRFNSSHEEIEVEALYIGQTDQQLPKILTAVIGDAPPDILWYLPMFTGQLVELGALRPLEDWFNQSPVKENLDPTLLETMRWNDHLWSIPMATNNLGLFYRTSLLREAGIIELPQTWEELREAARKLTQDKDGDGTPDQYGMFLPLGKGEWTVFSWLPFLFNAGGELVEEGKPQLVTEDAIAALQFWSNLLKDGSALLSQPERGYEQTNFIEGRVAMQLTGPWTLGFLPETPVGDDFGVMPIPYQDHPATVIGGENLFVMKTTPQREKAALTFLEYVLSEEFQTQWSLGTGYLPVNLQARQSKTYQDYVSQQPVLEVFLSQMEVGHSRPIIPGYARISNQLGRAIEASLLGTPPKKALSESQQRLNLLWDTH
ncbi:ABC transporter substrate-binding protein [Spirulina sp. CS-785/01]|uniref:ABC transporter substrate-binding protein n=1 Tax=Spirulina sp. CS-785/01 TaxID=3021716 RepID=UPI00232B425F|nr:ABC transporter substrate-binding protein [Spirulina sp. CS-785/01]MDB9315812.1 ABC transporter substrate-binding protein [Spirulina sp. CS-785/01]